MAEPATKGKIAGFWKVGLGLALLLGAGAWWAYDSGNADIAPLLTTYALILSVFSLISLNRLFQAANSRHGRTTEVIGAHEAALASMTRELSELAARAPKLHTSLHHVFAEREALHPKSGGRIDFILDASDLPHGFSQFLDEAEAEETEVRVLFLDPNSELVAGHRFALDHEGGVDYVRSNMRKAIAETARHATVRLYDALPLGNLIMVDDHIIYGGTPSVPTDGPLPLVELTLDTHSDIYWGFRRNFDQLWDRAKPVAERAEPAPSLVAGSM